MKTTQTQTRYVEWLSADEMHDASKEWISELKFIKDEHLFFEDLITTYTSLIIESGKFSDTTEIADAIIRSEKQNNLLIEEVETHENKLQIMVDGINQIKEEKAYVKEHSNLIIMIADYLKNYKSLKTQIFDVIKNIKKEDKFRHLIDKK